MGVPPTKLRISKYSKGRINLACLVLSARLGRRVTQDQAVQYVYRHWLHGQAAALRRRGIDPRAYFDELVAKDRRKRKSSPFDASVLEKDRREFE